MKFYMPTYEVKNNPEDDWEQVSEKFFVSKLVDSFELITPVLNEMFQGKEIITHDCLYRIRKEKPNPEFQKKA